MNLSINGEINEFANELTVQALLKDLGYSTEKIEIACNEDFIPRSDYDSTTLRDGDLIDIVTPMQGG